MYNPQRFKSEDLNEAFQVMERYPFADLITIQNQRPFISHLPLTPKLFENKIEIIGHLARANPQAINLDGQSVTIVFHGPHTYITPTWYATDDVPTWNYLAVHLFGRIQLIEDEVGLMDCLKDLTNHVEKFWPSGWQFSIPDDLSGDMLKKSIVGFRVSIEEIQFKKKLSQNRKSLDRAGVIKGLEQRSDDNSREILKEMKTIFDQSGEFK